MPPALISAETHAVTGAFGYSGRYIAQRLLDLGLHLITLTNKPATSEPLSNRIRAFPLNFRNPTELADALRGVRVLYNTYWVRFNHPRFTFAEAVHNTRVLFQAAREAGVERIVHVSITNPSVDSELEYFRGKAQLEVSLQESGMSYAILRPTVLFGKEDILINNIAWVLRHLPFFGVFGNGNYRLQPIYVDDFAQTAVESGLKSDNMTVNAIGPETFTYRELIIAIGKAIGCERSLVKVHPRLALAIGSVVGWCVGDVVITSDEIRGLMEERLYVNSPSVCRTRLTDWTLQNRDTLGVHYASEIARRTNR